MSSSTSSSSSAGHASARNWVLIVVASIAAVVLAFLAASEIILRKYVLQHDIFEWISGRLRASSVPNAAFGDSHVAAGPAFSTNGFENFGVGQTTIRRMDSRVRFYFGKVKPGMVIIQADPHLFAQYRLDPPGTYVPEYYFSRPRVFDERHRRFMFAYWERFIRDGTLQPAKESPRPQQLWEEITNTGKRSDLYFLPEPFAARIRVAQAGGVIWSDAAPVLTMSSSVIRAKSPPPGTPPGNWARELPIMERLPEKFRDEYANLLKYQVETHTPVHNYRAVEEARIYGNMLDFLIAKGARVCLLTYPVDDFYRAAADKRALFQEVIEFYKEMARKRNLPYVSKWDRFSDAKYFENMDHINHEGAKVMDPEVRKECFGSG